MSNGHEAVEKIEVRTTPTFLIGAHPNSEAELDPEQDLPVPAITL